MDISVIFPIFYCIVALASLILYIVTFASHKYIGFIYYRKHPDAKQEAAKQKMSPRRIAFAMIASVLIIADFVTLAVLNYNFYYWIKIYATMAFLVAWVLALCIKDFFGCIGGSIRRFSGLMSFLFTVEDEGAAYRYCKKGDDLLERVSSADTKVYLQYSYYEYDPPQVVERYQTFIRKYNVYGEEQELIGKKQLAIVEICTPKKFVLELDTQRKT